MRIDEHGRREAGEDGAHRVVAKTKALDYTIMNNLIVR
jgi:hypothetical protein